MVEVGHQLARQAADVDDVLEEADDLLVLLGSARPVEHCLNALPHAQRLVPGHPHDA